MHLTADIDSRALILVVINGAHGTVQLHSLHDINVVNDSDLAGFKSVSARDFEWHGRKYQDYGLQRRIHCIQCSEDYIVA